MKAILSLCLFACAFTSSAQSAINFNADWQMRGETVTLPRAWNEEYAYRVPIAELPDDTVRYVKTFKERVRRLKCGSMVITWGCMRMV